MVELKSIQDPPTRIQCFELMDEWGMLPNIRAHSTGVCDVSMTIAKALNNAGMNLDLDLVEAGALLHDITKSRSLRTRENHAVTGARLLKDLGYPKTAQVVEEHIIPADRGDALTPCEIVAYADKRVLHDRVVGLNERFHYLVETYGGSNEAMEHFERMRRSMSHIEDRIERITGISIAVLIPPQGNSN